MKCSACGSATDVLDVGDEGKPELLCKACVREIVADFFGEGEFDEKLDELTPYLVNEQVGV